MVLWSNEAEERRSSGRIRWWRCRWSPCWGSLRRRPTFRSGRSGPRSWSTCSAQWRSWWSCQTSCSSQFRTQSPEAATEKVGKNLSISFENKKLISYPWSRNGLDWLLLAHLLHGSVVFLLVFCHEHFQGATCVLESVRRSWFKISTPISDKFINRM